MYIFFTSASDLPPTTTISSFAQVDANVSTTPSSSSSVSVDGSTTGLPRNHTSSGYWLVERTPKGTPQLDVNAADLPACANNLPPLKTRHNQTQWCSNASPNTAAAIPRHTSSFPACPVSHMCVTLESKALNDFVGHCCPKAGAAASPAEQHTMNDVWNSQISGTNNI
jgi:hypothetical protein